MLDSDRGSGRQKIRLKTPGLVHIIESKATQRGMGALPWSCGWRPELGPARGGAHPDRHPAHPHATSPVSAGARVLIRIWRVPETPGPSISSWIWRIDHILMDMDRPQLGWWAGGWGGQFAPWGLQVTLGLRPPGRLHGSCQPEAAAARTPPGSQEAEGGGPAAGPGVLHPLPAQGL